MQFIHTETIKFNPVSGLLSISLFGQELSAKLRYQEIVEAHWVLPVVVSQLIEPLRLTLETSWEFVETMAEIQALEAQEQALHEVMVRAFHWATSDLNPLDNVRLLRYGELVRMSFNAYGSQLARSVKPLEMAA